jgi:hypothetical protein
MPVAFALPAPFNERGWRVKIRDRERVEPPHVTLLHKTRSWRFGLREKHFLDSDPPTRDVPGELLAQLLARTPEFTLVWNDLYPENPVHSQE